MVDTIWTSNICSVSPISQFSTAPSTFTKRLRKNSRDYNNHTEFVSKMFGNFLKISHNLVINRVTVQIDVYITSSKFQTILTYYY